jgi:hypothetical protein
MQKYLEKRLAELREKQLEVNFIMDRCEKDSMEYRINDNMLREIVVRIAETEKSLEYCKENRKPILIDVDAEMYKIEQYMNELDPELNMHSKHYKACSIAYNALLQLQILKKG